MSASIVSAIASSATTGLLAVLAFWLRKLINRIGLLRREHTFLMQTTARNTEAIRRILQHLELEQ